MNGYNRVILAGNLTRDPEMRYTPSGTAVAKFGLAVNRSWKNDSGQKQEEVTFVDIDCFGKQAELMGQYLKKGQSLLLEGRLKLDVWDDKQTQQKRSKLNVVMESFTFLDNGTREGDNAKAPPPTRGGRLAPPAEPADDSDVPY
jgi:single-strand DNA-binding protein